MDIYGKWRDFEKYDLTEPIPRVLPSWLETYLRMVASPMAGRPDPCFDAFLVIFPLVFALILPPVAYFDPQRTPGMTFFCMCLTLVFTVHLIIRAAFNNRIGQYKIEAFESRNKREANREREDEIKETAAFNKILTLKLSCASCRSKIADRLLESLGFDETGDTRLKLCSFEINEAPPTESCAHC